MTLKQMPVEKEYESIKRKYEDINSRFKSLPYLTTQEKTALLKDLAELNSFLKNNPQVCEKLEKEMEIVLLDLNEKYNGNRLKIMAYWIQRGEMNKESFKLRDDNLNTAGLMIDPKLRKRMQKTIEAIENMRLAEIEENANNLKIRKFYQDIIDIYKESIEIAKAKKIKYSGMLAGMEDAENFNNFMVGQIDASLAALISKEFAKMVYPYRNLLFKEKKEYTKEELELMTKLKVRIQDKINELTKEIEKNKEIKEKMLKIFQQIARGERQVPLEIVKEAAQQWKGFVPEERERKEIIEREISGLTLAYSALDRLQKSVGMTA